MSTLLFLASWLATWALCWWPLARVWPAQKHHFIVVDRSPRGMTTRWWELRGGSRFYAPLIATAVAFAFSAATGGLSEW